MYQKCITCQASVIWLGMRDNGLFLARVEGFEPPITGPEPVALPLGHTLLVQEKYTNLLKGIRVTFRQGFSSRIILLTQNFRDPFSRSSPFAIAQTQTTLRGSEPVKLKQFSLTRWLSPDLGQNLSSDTTWPTPNTGVNYTRIDRFILGGESTG